MDALAWAIAFVLMVVGMGGSAVGCVALVERGKNKRAAEAERTKRIGMENAWNIEQKKLELMEGNVQRPELNKPTEVTWDV